MAGAVIGAAHGESDYWASVGVRPEFGPSYAREIDAAARRWAPR